MRKFLSTLLIVTMAFSLVGCRTDHGAKYCGTWADETGNTVLVLNDNGSAIFSVDGIEYNLYWSAKNYDTVLLLEEVVVEATETTQSTEVTEPVDTTETAETTQSTEVTEPADTTESTETTQSTEPDGTTEGSEPPTDTAATEETRQKTERVTVATCTLSILDGVMYIKIVDAENNDLGTLSKIT